MMLPSIFGGSLFDDFMDSHWDKDFFGGKSHLMGAYEKNMMKTDIKLIYLDLKKKKLMQIWKMVI